MSRVENLKINYTDFSLNIVSWELPDKGISALVGPSGSGKTTIIKCLLGLEPCPNLHWLWNGEDIATQSVGHRRLAVVMQSYDLFPHMSAEDNIWFSAIARKIPEERAQKTFKMLVDRLKLDRILKTKAHYLSGGEKQRVALARAIMSEPRFLFLDEPFSALDAKLKSEARLLLQDILSVFNIPALLITHDENDVKQLATRVFKLENGQIN